MDKKISVVIITQLDTSGVTLLLTYYITDQVHFDPDSSLDSMGWTPVDPIVEFSHGSTLSAQARFPFIPKIRSVTLLIPPYSTKQVQPNRAGRSLVFFSRILLKTLTECANGRY